MTNVTSVTSFVKDVFKQGLLHRETFEVSVARCDCKSITWIYKMIYCCFQ